ncbi:MAG: GIN domain-containing protein [Bacteroidota bacterium]
MKHTVTVNLNGRLFYIDNDAYNLLDSYIKSLNTYFAKDSNKAEIIDDFEARIQELLATKKPNTGDVISIADVEEVIKTIGNPNDFGIDTEEAGDKSERKEYNSAPYTKPTKRLYRNPQDKMLGGVCSGLAAFTNLDVTLIRIFLVVLLFFSFGVPILVYLAMWIIVPEANTPQQQLEMRGEPVNLENIGRVVSDNAKSMAGDIKNAYNRANGSGCLSAILKVFLIVIGSIIAIPLVFALFVAVIVMVSVAMAFFVKFAPGMTTIGTISMGLLVGLPLMAAIYGMLSAIFKWAPLNKSIKVGGVLLWFVSLATTVIIAGSIDWHRVRSDRNWIYNMRDFVGKEWLMHSFDIFGIEGDGNIIERTLNAEDTLDVIAVRRALDVKIVEDSSIKDYKTAIVETDSNIMNYLDLKAEGNKLSISVRRNQKMRLDPSNDYIVVKVKKNLWKKLDVEGASDVVIVGDWQVPTADVSLGGASEVKIEDMWQPTRATIKIFGSSDFEAEKVEAGRLTFDVMGASDIKMRGKARYAHYELMGASEVDNRSLATDSVMLDVSGASELKVRPVKYMGGKLSGASELRYYGTPQSNNVSSSGASTINAVDED